MINVVSDHADYQVNRDPPLKSDIAGVTRGVSHWLWVAEDAASVVTDGAGTIPAVQLHRPWKDQIRAPVEALRPPRRGGIRVPTLPFWRTPRF